MGSGLQRFEETAFQEEGPGEARSADRRSPESQLEIGLALELVDGDEMLLLEIAEIYLRDSPDWVRGIKEAVIRADALTLKRVSHTLKGATSLFGANRVVELCQALELLAAQTVTPIEECQHFLSELERCVRVLEAELRRLIEVGLPAFSDVRS